MEDTKTAARQSSLISDRETSRENVPILSPPSNFHRAKLKDHNISIFRGNAFEFPPLPIGYIERQQLQDELQKRLLDKTTQL